MATEAIGVAHRSRAAGERTDRIGIDHVELELTSETALSEATRLFAGETVRGLLAGTHVAGGDAIAAVGWSVGLAMASYLWAIHLYNNRRPD